MATLHTLFLCLVNVLLLYASIIEAFTEQDEVHLLDRNKRAVARTKSVLWPNATVPYILGFGFTVVEREALMEILDDWSRDSCIRFVEWNGIDQYFVIFLKVSIQACYSFTGVQMHEPMPQAVYANPRCFEKDNKRELSHEIGHLLGFFHEHNRPDRDNFIDIDWNNVAPDKKHQFEKRHKALTVSFGSPYDFGSIMQYPLDYYSKNGKHTMVKKVEYDGPIGKNTKPSETDMQQLRYLYGCDTYVPGSGESGSGNLEYVEWEGLESSDFMYQLSSTVLGTNPTSIDNPPTISTTIDAVVFVQPTPTPIEPSITATESYFSTPLNSMLQSSITSTLLLTSSPIATLLPTKPSTSMTVPVTISTTPQLHILASLSDITPTSALATSTIHDTVQMTSQKNTPILLPTNEPGLVTGQLIGLKTQYSPREDRNYWLTCTKQRCRPRLCPGESFNSERQKKCTDSMFMLMEPEKKMSAPVFVGDTVVLLPYKSDDDIVSCGEEGQCKLDHLCYTDIGTFKPYCKKQVLSVYASGKNLGDRIINGDLVELRHYDYASDAHTESWIGCDPLLSRKCKRYLCPNTGHCEYEKFVVYVL